MNSATRISTAPAGPAAPISSMTSMDRFEAAVKRGHEDVEAAMERRELAHARVSLLLPPDLRYMKMPKATIRQRRMITAPKRGKEPPPALHANKARSIPIAILAQAQAEEWGEFSVATRLSQRLQAKVHDLPIEKQRRLSQYGKKSELTNNGIPYASYMECLLTSD